MNNRDYIICSKCRTAQPAEKYKKTGACPDCGEPQQCICCGKKVTEALEVQAGLIFYIPLCRSCFESNELKRFVAVLCLNCSSFLIITWQELERILHPLYYKWLKCQKTEGQFNFFFFEECGLCQGATPDIQELTKSIIYDRLN